VVKAVTADGFTCTSGGGPDVQNCDRGSDLVTAIGGVAGIHAVFEITALVPFGSRSNNC
jgi:hypothetical protein